MREPLRGYDLEQPPRSLSAELMKPRHCFVCGGVRLPGIRHAGEHQACDDQLRQWMEQVRAIGRDPEYVQAVRLAHSIWESRVKALGIPDWLKARVLAIGEIE